MKTKTKQRIGSLIVSLIFGATFGWYISTLISGFLSFNYSEIVFASTGAILIGLFGYKNPRTTELFSFLFSAWIILQVGWDGGAEPVFGTWRTIMTFIAFGNFILNGLTGYLRFKAGWKSLKRAMGGR